MRYSLKRGVADWLMKSEGVGAGAAVGIGIWRGVGMGMWMGTGLEKSLLVEL